MSMLSQKLTTSVLVMSAALLGAPFKISAQYSINTVAGGGPNGLPALQANIGYPGGIVQQGANTYVADVNSSRILVINSGTLTVFAGNGSGIGGEGGYSGDGGPPTGAQLGRPQGISVDAAGDVFIADTENSVIREVVAGSNTITTVAGVYYPPTQACNYAGDGGPASGAQLCRPGGVFVDATGDIFIADTENSVIRCVVGVAGGCFGSTLPVGSITTVAGDALLGAGYSGDGAAATSAQLDLPSGLFVDNSGNLYIADTLNSVIREVVAATGNIQTIAGAQYTFAGTCSFSGDTGPATSAQLCQPTAVFLDSPGNVFIADTDNNAIREVTGGVINTIAGTGGTAGYAGDGGPATNAKLNTPSGLFVDSTDDVFISDTDNFVIREVVATSGDIQTVAGNATVGWSGDGGAAIDASLYASGGVFLDGSGNLFIADTYNSVIREIPSGGSNIQTVAGDASLGAGYSGDGAAATSAQLNLPQGVFVDSLGDIFIADTENSIIRCVVGSSGGCFNSTLAVGSITTVAGSSTLGAGYSGDGGAAIAAQLQNPFGLFADGGGNLYIADTGNSRIRCVVGTSGGCFGSTLAIGSITTVAGTGTVCQPGTGNCGDGGPAGSALLNNPASVFVDGTGDLFIADTFDSEIREVAATTGIIQTVAGSTTSGYSGDGGPATSAELNEPYGVFVDSLGNIFIADTDNSVVREVVAATGNIQTIAGDGTEGYTGDGGAATSAELASPLGVASTATGTLFVADTENSRIRELVSTVSITTVPTSTTLPTGATQQFAATVTGASDPTVTWQVNGITGGNVTVGTISSLGSYQAPAVIPTSPSVTVTAIANANGVNEASAQVTIVSGSATVTLTLSTNPTVTEVYTGTTQTFVANVTDSTNAAVNWQVNNVLGGNSTVGTISTAGVYTAPAITVPTPATVIIGAVLQSNTNISASYPVVIVAAPTAPPPAPQTVSAGDSATYNLSLSAKTGDSRQVITLSCLKSSLPQGATCTFTPPTIKSGPSAVPFTVTVNLPVCATALERPNDLQVSSRFYMSFVPIGALLFFGAGTRKKRRQFFLVLALLFVPLSLLTGCGSGSSSGPSCPNLAGTYQIVVQGTTPAQPNPGTITTVTLTVQ